ncbi:FAD/NAD(P)-binding protein [Pseudoxanthomonas sp. UC29_72]
MHITLIGAGFCGSALAAELLRQGGPQARVTLVGQPETFGRGVAYGAARPEHLLNARAKDPAWSPTRRPGSPMRWRWARAGGWGSCRAWLTATICRTSCTRPRRRPRTSPASKKK